MNTNNGKGWSEQYFNSAGELSMSGSPDEERKFFETIIRGKSSKDKYPNEIFKAAEQFSKHNKYHKKQRVNHARIRAGFLDAQFMISPFLPPDLSFGFLKANEIYTAIARFSNASGSDSKNDKAPDLRGVAIKIKVNDREHDLLMTNAEIHHASNAWEAMAALSAGIEKDIWEHKIPVHTPLDKLGGLAALKYLRKALKDKDAVHRIANTLRSQMRRPVESLATETYWSRSPLAIGKVPDPRQSVAVKYRLLPVLPKSLKPKRQKDLEEEFYNRLSNGDVRFFFQVQTYINPEETPIEDATVAWPHNFQTIAELVIKRQSKAEIADRMNVMAYVDKLQFNPWNIDEANFLPIGSMNRIRKLIYPIAVNARQ